MSDKPDCKTLHASSLGRELVEDECKILASVMSIKQLKTGDILASRGDSNSTLYVLVDGKLDVYGESEGQEEKVYSMSKGECSGTRAFVDRHIRQATLKAVQPSTIYMLEPKDFETLLDSHPKIVYKVMRAIFRITHENLMKMNQETQQLSNYISKSGGRY